MPGLTGMSDGDAAEEDAWGEICQNAVPSLNMIEPDTGIPDMARILEESTATTAESDPAQSAGLTFKRGGELERSRFKLNRPRRGRPRVRIVSFTWTKSGTSPHHSTESNHTSFGLEYSAKHTKTHKRVYIVIYIYSHIYIYIYMYMYLFIYLYTHIHIYIYIYIYTHTRIHTHIIHIYIYIYKDIDIDVQACMDGWMYMPSRQNTPGPASNI